MTTLRQSRARMRSAAILVRVVAFLVAAASAIFIPAEIAAALLGHLAAGTALVAAGIATALLVAAVLAARGCDPLRTV